LTETHSKLCYYSYVPLNNTVIFLEQNLQMVILTTLNSTLQYSTLIFARSAP